MTVNTGDNPQVTVAPHCPACGGFSCAIVRSQGFVLEHEGRRHHAQKQYRKCRECRHNFGAIHIKGPVADRFRGWGEKPSGGVQ